MIAPRTSIRGVRNVEHLDTFRDADPRAWELALATAARAGLYVERIPPDDYWSRATVMCFTWSPSGKPQHYTTRYPNHPRPPRGLNAVRLMHHVMHHLCFTSAGSDTTQKPGAMLYFENIASSLDSYLAATVTQTLGVARTRARLQNVFPFLELENMSRRFGRPSSEYWHILATHDPLALYKRVVQETAKLQDLTRAFLAHFEPGRPSRSLAALTRTIRRQPYLVFTAYFNHTLHWSFARFHEGAKSSRRDRATIDRCARKLARARSLAEFMMALGAPAPAQRSAST